MKMKNCFLHLCVAAALLSSFAHAVPLLAADVIAEQTIAEGTESPKLTAPQNVRVEDGFIVWDEVEGAYGYRLRTTVNGNEISQTCYETRVEIDRFF